MRDKRNKKRTVRAVALLSAALISLSASLCSCSVIKINFDKIFPPETAGSNDTEPPTEDTVPRDTGGTDTEPPINPPATYDFYDAADAAEYLNGVVSGAVSPAKFDGGTVFIRTTDIGGLAALHPSINSEENEVNSYSEATFERNRLTEAALDCELHFLITTIDEMRTDIAAAHKNEEYYADLLAVSQGELAILASDGYLYNLRSLPFFDFDEIYFNESAVNALTAGYYTYGIASAATLSPDALSCVFINNGVLSEYYDGDIISLVKSGEWTWDTLLSLALTGAISLDADINQTDAAADLVSASCNLNFVVNEYKTTPYVSLPDNITEVADICRRLLASAVQTTEGGGEEADSTAGFISGGQAFYIGALGDMNSLANSKLDWNLAPLPKYDAKQQRYSTAAPAGDAILAVPAKMTNPDGASALLKALSAASYRYLRDAYSEYHMYNTVRHTETLQMIEIVYDSVTYDFARVFGGESKSLRNATYMLMREAAEDGDFNITKQFSRREDAANDALDDNFAPRNK